jgi:hypothetical protein
MVERSFDGATLRRSSVVLALLRPSPAPLTLPSGVALVVIGLMGTASLVYESRQPRMANGHKPASFQVEPTAARTSARRTGHYSVLRRVTVQ